MTLIAAHFGVTCIADRVQSLFTVAHLRGLLFLCMTHRAAFRVMTCSALDAVFLGVIAMMKRDNRAAAVCGVPHFLDGFIQPRESAAGASLRLRQIWLRAFLQVADFTGRVVTPFLMTSETLSVIRALQAGLLKILFGDVRGMAVLARGDSADFLKVVTVLTSFVHRGHLSMKPMCKRHRVIFRLNFVDENAIGTKFDVFNGCAWARTPAQTWIRECGVAADVTLGTPVVGTGFRVGKFASQEQREENGECGKVFHNRSAELSLSVFVEAARSELSRREQTAEDRQFR